MGRVTAGALRCVGQGLDALALEMQAGAEYQRTQRQLAREEFERDEARAEMAGAWEGLVLGFDDGVVDPEEDR